MPGSRLRVLGLSLAALAATVAAARAELIVFEDGRVVKAAAYRLYSDELEITLPGGGSYRVDLGRVDRIVDDEVVVDAVVVEPSAAEAGGTIDLSYRAGRRPLFATPYDTIIEREAKAFDIDAAFVAALIRAESNFEPRAVSRKGARGLMQLMPSTARRLSVRKPFDPASNVKGGVRYLRELVDRFGHRPDLVLAAYNAGEGVVESYGGVPPYRETIAYVNRILRWWTPAPGARSDPSAAVPGGAAARVETRN